MCAGFEKCTQICCIFWAAAKTWKQHRSQAEQRVVQSHTDHYGMFYRSTVPQPHPATHPLSLCHLCSLGHSPPRLWSPLLCCSRSGTVWEQTGATYNKTHSGGQTSCTQLGLKSHRVGLHVWVNRAGACLPAAPRKVPLGPRHVHGIVEIMNNDRDSLGNRTSDFDTLHFLNLRRGAISQRLTGFHLQAKAQQHFCPDT